LTRQPLTKDSELKYKQQLFVQEYLVDLNATQAAIRAGYSAPTAKETGYGNLQKPHIREAIQKAMDLRLERIQITADRILVELAKLGFSDIRNIFTESGQLRSVAELGDDIAAAIQSVEVVSSSAGKDSDGNTEIEYTHKIRLADKKAALELLGKHMKLFADKVEVSAPGGGPIEIDDKSPRNTMRQILLALELLGRQDTSNSNDRGDT